MTREVLLAQGWTDTAIKRAVRAHALRRVWPAVYTDSPVGASWVEYQRLVRAAGLAGGWGATSHYSAGALWDLPMLRPETSRVHTTIDQRHRGGLVSTRRHVHPRELTERDTTVLDGVTITTRARTAIDIAMRGDYEQALVVLDGVRRTARFGSESADPVSAAELTDIVERLGRRRGRSVAMRAIADSTHLSESAGESWSRARMLQWRLPAPTLQERFTIDGRLYFADFRWGRLIGEFDGNGKYESDAHRRRYEQRRDGDFATLGLSVCHWTWDDLLDRRRFHAILTSAMSLAGVIGSRPIFPG